MIGSLYDWFMRGNGQADESQRLRAQEASEMQERVIQRKEQELASRHERARQKQENPTEDTQTWQATRHKIPTEKQIYYDPLSELADDIKFDLNAWELIGDNRTLAAHEQARKAAAEAQSFEWQDAFKEYDDKNQANRLKRIENEIDEVLGKEVEPDNVFLNPGNGRSPYRQMAKLRETGTESEAQDVEPSTKSEQIDMDDTDWKVINELAKGIETSDQARGYANLAKNCDKDEVSDFWSQLAEEYDDDEIQAQRRKEQKSDDPENRD